MKKYLLVIIYCIANSRITSTQEILPTQFSAGFSTGIAKYSLFDQSINPYTYKGNAILPVKLNGSFQHNKNLFALKIYGGIGKLYPEKLNNAYYEYNYLKHGQSTLSLEYFRNIFQINSSLYLHLGVANSANLSLQKEFYKNLLYKSGSGYRKSYNFSLISLSPDILISYLFREKNIFCINFYYTPFSIAARSDDTYVKQIDLADESLKWKFYSPNEYVGYQFIIFYQRKLKHSTALMAEYTLQYNSYSTSYKFKYMRRVLLIGLSKSF